MNLFSKLKKDYNNLLEEILDRKTFSSISKSLLLSMIYKLGISYKDYSEVKIDCISKERFFSNLLGTIQKYCDNIKTVEPESHQAELLAKHNVDAVTNEKERSILAYPTENAMLYAVCDIEPKYFFVKRDFIFKNTLQKILVEGYKQNTLEILKDFNGWSWDVSTKKNNEVITSLIYQNLMMIKGEEFLYDWRTDNSAKKDYLTELKRSIKIVTENDDFYINLCKLLYCMSNKKEREKINYFLSKLEDEYQEFMKQSQEFRQRHNKRFNKLKIYHELFTNKKIKYEVVCELQKNFLYFMEKKIERVTRKEDILEVIYQLRYYANIRFYENTFIKQNEELRLSLNSVLKLAITKACKLGSIKIVTMDIEDNFEILKYVLDTKIPNLEDIRLYVELQGNRILFKVYDKDVFEKEGSIEFSGIKKDVVFRKKLKVKLFI